MATEGRKNPDERWLNVVATVSVLGMAAIGLFAWQAETWAARLSVAAVAAVLAGAALLAGGLVGFLFGIPRRLQVTKEAQDGSDGNLYGANTNLEQISDWLTKILVGVGLTQIREIGTALASVGEWMGKGLGGGDSGKAFAVALIVFFAIAGFLIAYLWTRLRLVSEFSDAEKERHRLDAVDRQSQADVHALALVARQLSGEDTSRPSQEALNRAVAAATSETRAHIFYRAQLVRGRNWRDPATKAVMERTIPIFGALVASDMEGRYHANHGQLGFALKDQRKPDWAAAEAALTRAIDIRRDPDNADWRSYEFNRALCRIMLDGDFRENRASAKDAVQRIEADLRAAREDPWVWAWREETPAIGKWASLNGVKL